MSLAQTTPQVTAPPQAAEATNPFDAPLQSEQQAGTSSPIQPQRTAQGPPESGNPFDEPLASEKVQAQPRLPASNFASGSKVPNAILNGSDTTGDIIGGATIAGAAALAADPVVTAVVSHLGGLNTIVKAAKALGWTSFGLKEAHDLYNMFNKTGK
jgi:hypothetical protein